MGYGKFTIEEILKKIISLGKKKKRERERERNFEVINKQIYEKHTGRMEPKHMRLMQVTVNKGKRNLKMKNK